jgi:hypothetical protein
VDGMLHLPPLNGHDNGTKVEWPDLPMPVPDVKWANRTLVETVLVIGAAVNRKI